MAKAALHRHHALDYLELVATDLAAMKRFYKSAFGWSFNDYGPDYVGFVDGDGKRAGGKEAGGIRRVARKPSRKAQASSPLLPILYSEALEKTLTKVRKAGGRVTKEIFSFPGGRRFQFVDPSGLELAVWSDR